jgi:hypothetical protein
VTALEASVSSSSMQSALVPHLILFESGTLSVQDCSEQVVIVVGILSLVSDIVVPVLPYSLWSRLGRSQSISRIGLDTVVSIAKETERGIHRGTIVGRFLILKKTAYSSPA